MIPYNGKEPVAETGWAIINADGAIRAIDTDEREAWLNLCGVGWEYEWKDRGYVAIEVTITETPESVARRTSPADGGDTGEVSNA